MDAKIVAISAAVVLVIAFFACMAFKVFWRITSGKYPPTRHVVKLDDAQLKIILGKIKTT